MPETVDDPIDRWLRERTPEEQGWLATLWGKSEKAGGPSLLVQHMLDSLAVAELIWDRFLAPCLRRRYDEATSMRGRSLLMWLSGLHDLGKATPAFQCLDDVLCRQVEAAGLHIEHRGLHPGHLWRHDRSGAATMRAALHEAASGADQSVEWLWPLIGGHHGRFMRSGELFNVESRLPRETRCNVGEGPWGRARSLLVELITATTTFGSVTDIVRLAPPARADQLALSGYVMMADWIASSFPGVNDWEDISLIAARLRAETAWVELDLSGGWKDLPDPGHDPIRERFGRSPYPTQALAVDSARSLNAPGLLIVEAPMGEGKTESALAAAEVLAFRFGADGVAIAMPTQATADPMLERVSKWVGTVDPDIQVALLHGRRRFNPLWQAMLARRSATAAAGVESSRLDAYGMADDLEEFSIEDPDVPSVSGICEDAGAAVSDGLALAASEWVLGRHRGLLAGVVVATFDQLLYAATRTKYVAPRYAGLAGKVVIFDEVHAADEYMTEFLLELLAWLGSGRVPVVLLSATLHTAQRDRMIAAYASGGQTSPEGHDAETQQPTGYPAVTSMSDGGVATRAVCEPARRDRTFVVSLLEDPSPSADPNQQVVDELQRLMEESGCALIIRNTVDRAQATFLALRAVFGEDVVLLHSQFTAATRAERTEQLVRELGPDGKDRPRRRIVVATQVAEQSFDVDVDLLVTDVAPLDLVLQRVGRLHRHDRPHDARPWSLRDPRVLVTGVQGADSGRPQFPKGAEAIYGRHRLLRSLAAVKTAKAEGGWRLPSSIAALVESAYAPNPVIPREWCEDEASARRDRQQEVERCRAVAASYRLTKEGERTKTTLEGLTDSASDVPEDLAAWIGVRENDMGEEVLLVRKVDGRYETLDGTNLGVNGEAVHGHDPVAVLGGTVRLPGHASGLNVAAKALDPLPEWHDHPWLGHTKVLALGGELSEGTLEANGRRFRVFYDDDLGLRWERT
ncbi:MAG: CRISPR-associated helicase Cas3' [Acidimicrobiia bacterium]